MGVGPGAVEVVAEQPQVDPVGAVAVCGRCRRQIQVEVSHEPIRNASSCKPSGALQRCRPGRRSSPLRSRSRRRAGARWRRPPCLGRLRRRCVAGSCHAARGEPSPHVGGIGCGEGAAEAPGTDDGRGLCWRSPRLRGPSVDRQQPASRLTTAIQCVVRVLVQDISQSVLAQRDEETTRRASQRSDAWRAQRPSGAGPLQAPALRYVKGPAYSPHLPAGQAGSVLRTTAAVVFSGRPGQRKPRGPQRCLRVLTYAQAMGAARRFTAAEDPGGPSKAMDPWSPRADCRLRPAGRSRGGEGPTAGGEALPTA